MVRHESAVRSFPGESKKEFMSTKRTKVLQFIQSRLKAVSKVEPIRSTFV